MVKKGNKRKCQHPKEARECRQYFYDRFEKVKGRPYNPNFPKDIMLMDAPAGRFGVAWVKGLIDFYLQWDEPFVKQCGYTTGVFVCKINQMLEMGIHKSHWVRDHEKVQMKSSKAVMGSLLKELIKGQE